MAVLQLQYQQLEAGGLQVQSQPRKPERWLRGYDLGLVPRTHMVTHDYLYQFQSIWSPSFSFLPPGMHMYIYVHAHKTLTHKE